MVLVARPDLVETALAACVGAYALWFGASMLALAAWVRASGRDWAQVPLI